MISQLPQGMKQPVRVRGQVFDQLPRGQESGMGKNRPLQIATTSQVQPQPRPEQRVDQSEPNKPRRQFTQLNTSLSQALQHLLRLNLITLRDPPKNQNTVSPKYNPNARCAYHSDSPRHNTNDCWSLKNKIQDLIDEGAVKFTQDGQAEFFYYPCKTHHLK